MLVIIVQNAHYNGLTLLFGHKNLSRHF